MSVDDGSTPTDDERLKEQIEQIVDDDEHGGHIGVEMAKDAQRLVDGELSEAEFRDRYGEILDKLQDEETPTPDAFEEIKGDLEDVDIVEKIKSLDSEEERRETMKKMAAGAAFLGLGAWATLDQQQQTESVPTSDPGHVAGPDEDDTRYGFVIDLERCDGCLNCVMGCLNENQWGPGENWMYVVTWLDQEIADQLDPDDEVSQEEANFLVRPCQHCNDPPCAQVCPTTARHQRDDGLVLTDYDVCIGCRYCQVGCPYGVNYFGWGDPETPRDEIQGSEYTSKELRRMDDDERQELLADSNDHLHDDRGRWVDSRPPKGVMGKCTACPTRQDGHMGEDMVGTVACMDWCDSAGMHAIHFGDLNDPESRPNQYRQWRKELAEGHQPAIEGEEDEPEWVESVLIDGDTTPPGKVSEFRLLESMGTDPSIVYIGNEPGSNAEQVDPAQVEHAATYESAGTVDRRQEVLDQGAAANQGDD